MNKNIIILQQTSSISNETCMNFKIILSIRVILLFEKYQFFSVWLANSMRKILTSGIWDKRI